MDYEQQGGMAFSDSPFVKHSVRIDKFNKKWVLMEE
jgi:hypothetical protein